MTNHHGEPFDHERSDVAPRWPIFIGIGMLLTLPIAVALVSALMNSVWAPPAEPQQPDIAAAEMATGAPRLQTNPQQDLAALRKQWDERLHSTGWVDRGAGIVHVPIAQAKQRLVAQGLPHDTRAPGPSRARATATGSPGQDQPAAVKQRAADRVRSTGGRKAGNVKPPAGSAPAETGRPPGRALRGGNEKAGLGSAHGARNRPAVEAAVPYRQGEMAR